jgi:signal transduction histidine kinase
VSESTFNLDGVRAQQASLHQQGQLHWVHWSILVLSVTITVAAWDFSNKLLETQTEIRFDSEAERVVHMMQERLGHYGDALRSGASVMQAYDGIMTRERWKNYATALSLQSRYPGVNGIGVIREITADSREAFEAKHELLWPEFRIFPEHEHKTLLPIVFIEPAQSNAAAIGLDVAFEENRRTAALLARSLGTLQISGPIALVQDEGKTPGFLFYMPFFLDDTGFGGHVYAPLVVKNLVAGVLGDQKRQVFFSIRDENNVLYEEFSDASRRENEGSLQRDITRTFYGREWKFTIQASDAFYAQSSAIQPTVVLISGLIIDGMLLLLFIMMARSNRKVLSLADIMTAELGEQANSLTQKNAELESFAYVVSHDLKTPINSIRALSEFIEEDIDELISDVAVKDTLRGHTGRINEQVDRGDALIKGILEYSIAGHTLQIPENIDVEVIIHDVCQSLGIPSDQIYLRSPMPVFDLYPVQLTQVFENLIGNAHKYHPRPNEAQIVVTVEDNDSFHRFYVTDDGDGIDPKYHDRIFNPFVTLQTKPCVTSSGIGLSIVKKSIEAIGGQVGIVDNDCQGTTFYFDWPKFPDAINQDMKHAA